MRNERQGMWRATPRPPVLLLVSMKSSHAVNTTVLSRPCIRATTCTCLHDVRLFALCPGHPDVQILRRKLNFFYCKSAGRHRSEAVLPSYKISQDI